MASRYKEVTDILEKEILSGKYNEQKKLPTEDQLSEQLKISKLTLRKAIDTLVTKGYLYRIQGSGIFLRDFLEEGSRDVIESAGFTRNYSSSELTNKVLEFSLVNADAEIAAQMKCKVGTKLYYVKRIRYIDSEPIEIEESYFNKEIIPYMNEEICRDSIFSYFREDLKLKIGFSDRIISCDKLKKDDAEILGLNENDPTMIFECRTYLNNGIIFDISKETYNYHKIKFISLATKCY